MKVRERLLFFRGFLKDVHRIGSVTPSSRWLARAMTAELEHRDGPARCLEVGAGTGVITQEILRKLRAEDTLDIYEMNGLFACHLRKRFMGNGTNGQVQIFAEDILASPPKGKYDFIISGLPMNNFPADSVRAIFGTFFDLLASGGRLSFFQYIFGRPVQSVFVGRAGRRRLKEVGAFMGKVLEEHEYRRIPVLGNFPPANAHHLRVP